MKPFDLQDLTTAVAVMMERRQKVGKQTDGTEGLRVG
jgi:hypothetical protein